MSTEEGSYRIQLYKAEPGERLDQIFELSGNRRSTVQSLDFIKQLLESEETAKKLKGKETDATKD